MKHRGNGSHAATADRGLAGVAGAEAITAMVAELTRQYSLHTVPMGLF
jgi:hypothetical protein